MARKKKKIVLPIVAGVFALGAIGSLIPSDTEASDNPRGTDRVAIVEQEIGVESKVTQDIIVKLSPEQEAGNIIPEPVETIEPSEKLTVSERGQIASPMPETATTVSPTPELMPEPKETSKPVQEPVKTPEPEPTPEPAPSIDPEQAFREKLNQYAYVGSSESDKYHYPSCKWTNKINDGNLVHFESVGEAAAAGYSPCGTCHPK